MTNEELMKEVSGWDEKRTRFLGVRDFRRARTQQSVGALFGDRGGERGQKRHIKIPFKFGCQPSHSTRIFYPGESSGEVKTI